MPNIRPRKLVIDASIARASGGEDATFPISKYCRDFLVTVRNTGHSAVFNAAITEEWNHQQSGFARTWRVSMIARRRIINDDSTADINLRKRIEKTSGIAGHQKAMLKDCHLIEAAIANDQTITSLDEEAKRLFGDAAKLINEIKEIIWVNPSVFHDQCVIWLKNGAKSERCYMLSLLAENIIPCFDQTIGPSED